MVAFVFCNNFCNLSFLLSFIFVVFAGCVFFLLVSLLLIILRHSFLSLDFCLLVFLACSLSSFLRSMFFFLLLVLSSSCFFCPSLMFLSVTRPYLVLMFPFVLCFLFVSRLIFFLLCVFSPCSSSFSSFVFSSPQAPACA